MTNLLKLFIFSSLLMNGLDAKRCKRRKNTGFSCQARCDYRTGRWRGGCVLFSSNYDYEYYDEYVDYEDYEDFEDFEDKKPEKTTHPSECLTVSNKPCVFPITVEGQTFESCILLKKNIEPRCATDVVYDKEGKNDKILDWDYCNKSCPFSKVMHQNNN